MKKFFLKMLRISTYTVSSTESKHTKRVVTFVKCEKSNNVLILNNYKLLFFQSLPWKERNNGYFNFIV